MKKMLLSVVAALTMTASAFAATVGDTYQRVESTADLTLGAEYIICYDENAMGAYNLDKKIFDNVKKGVTLSTDKKTATIANVGVGVLPITIVSGTVDGTYAFTYKSGNSNVYMTCTSINSTNIKQSDKLVANSNLSISFNNSQAVIIPTQNSNDNKNKFQYNPKTPRYSNYKTGSQENCTLYKKIDDNKVATPTFTPASGSAVVAGSTVTIACEEGANIYYTTDETNPTEASTPYTEPIVVNEAMTIKAIAYMEGKTPSSVATATYTIMPSVANIAEFIDLIKNGKDGLYSIQTSVTAVYQNGSNLYITDGKDWLLVYGNVEKKYENGDVIAKGIVGKPLNYSNGLYELSNPDPSTFAAGVAGTPVEPIIVTKISAEDVNKYVKVQNVNITGQGVYAQDANGNLYTIYDKFKIKPSDATGVNLIGFVGVSKGALKIYPTEITVAAPTFNPAAGEVEAGTKVTISCATEGAEIEYVLNGGSDYIKYTEPIEITEATTIEAYATKDGLEMSDIATAVYTIKKPVVATPTFDPATGSTLSDSDVISIYCGTTGAKIYYTTDGTEPTTASTLYENSFKISKNTTVKAIAVAEGYLDSDVATATYVFETTNNPSAEYDFTNPTGLVPAKAVPSFTADDTNPAEAARIFVDERRFYNNYTQVEFKSPAVATYENKSQLWNVAEGVQVRSYSGSQIIITGAEGLTIGKIEFVGAAKEANLAGISVVGNLGAYAVDVDGTVGTWTRGGVKALAAGKREEIVFNVATESSVKLKSISITTSGIATGVEDVTVDENAPVEYYNLQGVRVDNPENGIYIRRQGSKVSKVLVR